MVKAWYLADTVVGGDKKLPHMTDPPQLVSVDELNTLTGIKYWQVNADDYENDTVMKEIREQEGYTFDDQIDIKPAWSLYNEMTPKFYTEHLHLDDESRLILEGSGYFDIRSAPEDRWIRVEVVKGDLVVLPAGIYHRFTITTTEHCMLRRFFTTEPAWASYPRPEADTQDARKTYIQKMGMVQG